MCSGHPILTHCKVSNVSTFGTGVLLCCSFPEQVSKSFLAVLQWQQNGSKHTALSAEIKRTITTFLWTLGQSLKYNQCLLFCFCTKLGFTEKLQSGQRQSGLSPGMVMKAAWNTWMQFRKQVLCKPDWKSFCLYATCLPARRAPVARSQSFRCHPNIFIFFSNISFFNKVNQKPFRSKSYRPIQTAVAYLHREGQLNSTWDSKR